MTQAVNEPLSVWPAFQLALEPKPQSTFFQVNVEPRFSSPFSSPSNIIPRCECGCMGERVRVVITFGHHGVLHATPTDVSTCPQAFRGRGGQPRVHLPPGQAQTVSETQVVFQHNPTDARARCIHAHATAPHLWPNRESSALCGCVRA